MSSITTINGGDLISGSRTVINANFSALNTDKIETSVIDTSTDLDGASASDAKIPSQLAVKTYVDSVASPVGKSWNEYAVDAVGTDSYGITLTGFTAYVAGQTFKFKAGTANTGACSLNVNGLGAKTIKKDVTTDLATGDILANQVVTVIYDGTNMQLQSLESGIAKTADLPTENYTVGALRNSLVKTYFNIQLLFILWTGVSSGAADTSFANWVRSDGTDVILPPMGVMADFRSTGSCYLVLSNFLYKGASDNIEWDNTNTVILDWWAKLAASGTGDVSMGFVGQGAGALLAAYNATDQNRVMFNQSAAGALYATISKTSVGVTNTDISSGLTLTNWNNYRIELDLSNNALFYINGVLKATLSGVNFPTDSDGLDIGFGRSNTSLFQVTAPNLSLEMNG